VARDEGSSLPASKGFQRRVLARRKRANLQSWALLWSRLPNAYAMANSVTAICSAKDDLKTSHDSIVSIQSIHTGAVSESSPAPHCRIPCPRSKAPPRPIWSQKIE
jgi:hypothetical protein